MKKLLLVFIFATILLPIIHKMYPENPYTSWLSAVEGSNLLVELIGSGILALVIGMWLFSHEEDVRRSQNKERSSRFFEKVILNSVKNSFDRPLSTLNRSHSMNCKAYYDNSSINNLHDVIERYLDSIIEFNDYNSEHSLIGLSKRLVEFYDTTQEAYRRGEELDILLDKMANITNVDKNAVFYVKGFRYAEFEDDELKVLLADASGKNNFFDFYERHFTNPESDLKLRYKNNFVRLDKQMRSRVKSLRQKTDEIKNLLFAHTERNEYKKSYHIKGLRLITRIPLILKTSFNNIFMITLFTLGLLSLPFFIWREIFNVTDSKEIVKIIVIGSFFTIPGLIFFKLFVMNILFENLKDEVVAIISEKSNDD